MAKAKTAPVLSVEDKYKAAVAVACNLYRQLSAVDPEVYGPSGEVVVIDKSNGRTQINDIVPRVVGKLIADEMK